MYFLYYRASNVLVVVEVNETHRLCVMQHGATRDYVIHMARTPHREKDKSGAAAEVTLDDKLLSNHARQV
jgi:hypothetical protein